MMLLTLVLCAGYLANPPPTAPQPEEWTFRQELAVPAVYHAREALEVVDRFGLTNELETVREDLTRFMASAAKKTAKKLVLQKGRVKGNESYRCEVAANGDVTLTAEDDAGIRRAAYWYEDRNAAGDLKPCVRKPWLRNRISRCFFGPIKRPPFNRDELMDDVDYYPDAYLNRLAHEGINGLWLTIELRNIVETSFNKRDPDAPRRIAKLRRTVDKCRRYGIATWIFCIEPRAMTDDSPLLKNCPQLTSGVRLWDGQALFCPSTPEGQRYLEEATRDLFTQVPGLPGILNISHGERPTTCLSECNSVTDRKMSCARCRKLAPWQVHAETASSIVKGMRAVNPKAEFLSWFYQPYVDFKRQPWVFDIARHLPDGVTLIYNFESGAVKEQLGRDRAGGDYWLSYVGPAPAFQQVAEAAKEVHGSIGAKIQVGNSHECATVPFVPAPGLLYRKYKAMRAANCTSVMQCWYFGNYPGVMNKAAGELAFDDFTEDETTFLLRLARPEWGSDAPQMARFWKALSNAYAHYPLSNDMQYYGPFHAGIAWTMEPYVRLHPLARTWKPQDPPGGDTIGECLENHTLAEASLLASQMAVDCGDLEPLLRKYAKDRDRELDLGVVKALHILFSSGADILEFYRQRNLAVHASRDAGDNRTARVCVARMRDLVLNEKALTDEMLPLTMADSRLGFHSEAEQHQFFSKKLVWRQGELDRALGELKTIDEALAAGRPYPLSPEERKAPQLECGRWTPCTVGQIWLDFAANGDLVLVGRGMTNGQVNVRTLDACGVTWAHPIRLLPDGNATAGAPNAITPTHVIRSYSAKRETASTWGFRLVLDARAWADSHPPTWIHVGSDLGVLPTLIYPGVASTGEARLNIGLASPDTYARIVPTKAAQWISVPEQRVHGPKDDRMRATDGTSWFATTFTNDAAVVRAVWTVCGLGVFDVYVNGQRVGSDFLKPGFTQYSRTKYAYTYDVTSLLKRERGAVNTLAAEVSAGWWRDTIVMFRGEKSAFRGELKMKSADNAERTILTSPSTWRCGIAGEVTHAGIYDGEIVDARISQPVRGEGLESIPENNVEFAGEILPVAGAKVTLRRDLTRLPERAYVWQGVSGETSNDWGTVKIVRTCERNATITLKPGETLVLDYGQNAAAVPEFEFAAKRGTTLTALPAEMLNDGNGAKSRGNDGPEGSVYRVNLRSGYKTGRLVKYTFAGGQASYLPRFSFFGYRYLSITATDEVTFTRIAMVPVSSITAASETGTVKTGDDAVNRLIANAWWGMLSNYLSIPTDCPQRDERQGWTADTQVFTETAGYFANVSAFHRKWMRDMRDSQQPKGGYTSVAPFASFGQASMRLGWADAGIIVPYTVWRQFGDRAIVDENWASMARYAARVRESKYRMDEIRDECGNSQYADWLSFEDYETCSGKGRKHPAEARRYWDYLGAAYGIIDARYMAAMAKGTGRDETPYREMDRELTSYVKSTFFSSPDGLIDAPYRNMQTPALFALHLGLVEGAARERTITNLLANFKAHGGSLQTGFLGTSILMDTLTEVGCAKTAYDVLLNHGFPGWLYSVDQGATTVWERWNSYTKEKGFGPVGMNSFNHYAYGAVVAWLFKSAAGIAPAEPGYKKIILAPHPDRRLGSIEATYNSPVGKITSAWQYDTDGTTWRWTFTIPPNTTAEVYLPGETTPKTYGEGTHTLTTQQSGEQS